MFKACINICNDRDLLYFIVNAGVIFSSLDQLDRVFALKPVLKVQQIEEFSRWLVASNTVVNFIVIVNRRAYCDNLIVRLKLKPNKTRICRSDSQREIDRKLLHVLGRCTPVNFRRSETPLQESLGH